MSRVDWFMVLTELADVTIDFKSEPLFTFARDALRQKELGPVLYWNLKMEGFVADGSKYQATPWRTIPDYQGGEFEMLPTVTMRKLS